MRTAETFEVFCRKCLSRFEAENLREALARLAHHAEKKHPEEAAEC
jgi:hypothetical protein